MRRHWRQPVFIDFRSCPAKPLANAKIVGNGVTESEELATSTSTHLTRQAPFLIDKV